MNPENEIQKLIRARRRMEAKIRELDQKIEHLRYRLEEEHRCMVRKCPFDTDDDFLHDLPD